MLFASLLLHFDALIITAFLKGDLKRFRRICDISDNFSVLYIPESSVLRPVLFINCTQPNEDKVEATAANLIDSTDRSSLKIDTTCQAEKNVIYTLFPSVTIQARFLKLSTDLLQFDDYDDRC